MTSRILLITWRLFCLAVIAVVMLRMSATAAEKSLLPPFGDEGSEFTTKSKDGHSLHGWLPKGWDDNSEWAPLTATYSKLDETPAPGITALRIALQKMDDGQLQLTSYAGEQVYKRGRAYRVAGWLRSSDSLTLAWEVRQVAAPYSRFFEGELPADGTWKPFAFDFQPQADVKAIIMFSVRNVGTMDLAGVTVTEKTGSDSPPLPGKPATKAPTARSLLPPFGPDGEEFTTKAKGNHLLHGWSPKGWEDNSEWAPISATYSKINDDSPGKKGAALRIHLEQMDDGQLQFTSGSAERVYERARIYRIAGWMRSPDHVPLSIVARQSDAPYEAYFEQDMAPGTEWQPFEFEFAPKNDIKAIIMFLVKKTGTLDLAGVTATDEGSAE